MQNPIFVKVRNDQNEFYPSYDIINQLIDWNFESCELDKVEPDSNNTYIFIPDNGNVKACCERPHKAKYILWNIEIPGQVEEKCPDYMDEMWLSCKYFYSLVPDKKKFVVLGGDKRLYKDPDPIKQWAFCHLSYLYGKRLGQVKELEARGYTMAPIGWGETRDKSIASSEWGLCLHQNPVPALSPQRMTLYACRKLPIVIEECNPYPYKVVKLKDFTGKDYKELAEENFKLFTETYTFKKCVERAI